MKRKAQLLLMSGCVVCASAHAQSSVTLYGIVDTGVEYVNHANSANDRVIRMPAITGSLPSRWGIRGAEDIGGGYQVIFALENGFNVRGGDAGQGGRLFGRQAWVGGKSEWGSLTFGRQQTMTYVLIAENELIGPAIYGIASLDSYLSAARSDNTILYKGTFSGITFGASYSFGRDAAGTGNSPGQGTCAGSVPGDYQQCKQWTAVLKYDGTNFGLGASYDQQRGGANAAANFFDGVAPSSITSSGDKDTRIQANAYIKFDGFRASGGWLGRQVSPSNPAVAGVRSNLYYLEAQYYFTPAFILDGGVFRIVNASHDTRATLATIRTTYLLSKSSSIYAQVGDLANSRHAKYSVSAGGGGTTPPAGENQLGIMVGIRHLF